MGVAWNHGGPRKSGQKWVCGWILNLGLGSIEREKRPIVHKMIIQTLIIKCGWIISWWWVEY